MCRNSDELENQNAYSGTPTSGEIQNYFSLFLFIVLPGYYILKKHKEMWMKYGEKKPDQIGT